MPLSANDDGEMRSAGLNFGGLALRNLAGILLRFLEQIRKAKAPRLTGEISEIQLHALHFEHAEHLAPLLFGKLSAFSEPMIQTFQSRGFSFARCLTFKYPPATFTRPKEKHSCEK